MKTLYILSGLAIFNLVLVAIIASFSVNPQTNLVVPTPQVLINKVVKKVQRFTGGTASALPSINQSTSSSNTVTNKCIVTIDSLQYDVTSFRNMHSGGDIFNCGSNMSAIFWNRHSQRQLNQMQQFKI